MKPDIRDVEGLHKDLIELWTTPNMSWRFIDRSRIGRPFERGLRTFCPRCVTALMDAVPAVDHLTHPVARLDTAGLIEFKCEEVRVNGLVGTYGERLLYGRCSDPMCRTVCWSIEFRKNPIWNALDDPGNLIDDDMISLERE